MCPHQPSWAGSASGNWEDPRNWSPQTVPGPGDTAQLQTDCSVITANASVTVGVLDIGVFSWSCGTTLQVASGSIFSVNTVSTLGLAVFKSIGIASAPAIHANVFTVGTNGGVRFYG